MHVEHTMDITAESRMAPLNVLLLEDRPSDVKLIIHALRRAGFDPQWQNVQDEKEFLNALSPELDVILADYNLPQFDALRALRMVQEHDLDVPFIVVTGTLEEAAMECVKEGAADYLLKDRLARLGEAIKNALHEKRLREEKRQTEAALRESERQLRLAINAAQMGTWEWNLKQNRVSVSGQYEQLFGVNAGTLSGGFDLTLVHPDDRKQVELTVQQAIEEASAYQAEFRIIRPDGEMRWIFGQGQVYLDEYGEPSHMSGVVQDITERKQAEQRTLLLQEITAALSEAVTPEQVADVIVGRVLTSLGGHAGTVSLLDEERRTLDLVSTSGGPTAALKPGAQISLNNGGPLTQAVASGQPVWLENPQQISRAYPAQAEKILSTNHTQALACLPLIVNQRVIGGIGIGFAEPRRIREEDRALLMALAHQCAQAIERARLYAMEQNARAVAEEANQLKTQFLAMVSHELRTPLTSIIGFITTLLSPDVEWSQADQADFLQVINEESQKLKELVEQLLDVSRLQAGMLSIHQQRRSVTEILDTASAQLLSLTSDHKLQIDIPDEMPTVLADDQRIAQVLVNLVDNAVKYSPAGTQITVTAQPAGEEYVQIDVVDEGEGIPREAYDQVFEAFRQLGRESVPEKGVGLGLAICRALVEAHGGRIWVNEPKGRGTRISFVLPIAREEEASRA